MFRDLWHPHRFLLNEFPIMNGAFINSFNIDARSSFRLIQTCYLILCVSSTERCNDKIIRKLIQHRQSSKNPIFDLLTSNKSLRIHFTSRQQSKNILNPLLIIWRKKQANFPKRRQWQMFLHKLFPLIRPPPAFLPLFVVYIFFTVQKISSSTTE